MDKPPRRKPLHLKGFDYKGSSHVYFVTICTTGGKPYFLKDRVARIISEELDFRRGVLREIELLCYCIMPDHIHLLLRLTEDYKNSLQDWVSSFKRHSSKRANDLFHIKPFFQRNFYEHVVRREESLLEIARYIVNNPVRRGLVEEWNGYPYSWISDDFPA